MDDAVTLLFLINLVLKKILMDKKNRFFEVRNISQSALLLNTDIDLVASLIFIINPTAEISWKKNKNYTKLWTFNKHNFHKTQDEQNPGISLDLVLNIYIEQWLRSDNSHVVVCFPIFSVCKFICVCLCVCVC
ncbi:UNVERIFIED_CONTAM: hypothetical protein K2H54_063842 [Gekko kuhli]